MGEKKQYEVPTVNDIHVNPKDVVTMASNQAPDNEVYLGDPGDWTVGM